jgi:DDE family transposase
VDAQDHYQDRRATATAGHPGERAHRRPVARQATFFPPRQPQEDRPGCRSTRDRQFLYITRLRRRFCRQCNPIISVDAKKRELVGNFKNAGRKWDRVPTPVNDHDFRSMAVGIAIPFGVYDPQANRGSVFVGVSHETSAFAVTSICRWWNREGRQRYAHAQHLLILADTGGSNSATRSAWKDQLQQPTL